jgi:hypothetical protein
MGMERIVEYEFESDGGRPKQTSFSGTQILGLTSLSCEAEEAGPVDF